MTGYSRLLAQSLRRGRKSFLLSAAGVAVGIASLTFFLALGAGARRVIERIFPAAQLEVVPRKMSEGLLGGLSGGPRALDQSAITALQARPEVAGAFRRLKVAFPARAWGGKNLIGKDVFAELIADGLEPGALADDPQLAAAFQTPPPGAACQTDAECAAPTYCPWDTHRCEPPVPVIFSPVLLELYNGTIAPSHGLPRLTRFMLDRLRGFTFNVELGRSYIATAPRGEPHQRRLRLAGVSPMAAPLALTLPLDLVQRWNAEYAGDDAARHFSSVVLRTRAGADVTRLAEAVRQLGFDVADSGAEQAGLAVTLVTLLLLLISLSTLAVATVSIAHTFLRAVAERRREIGVLKAVGASRGEVEALLCGEAVAVGLAGGVAGVILARIGAFAVDFVARRYVPDFPFKPESFFDFGPLLVIAAVVVAALACLVGALVPARAAGRLDAAAALVA